MVAVIRRPQAIDFQNSERFLMVHTGYADSYVSFDLAAGGEWIHGVDMHFANHLMGRCLGSSDGNSQARRANCRDASFSVFISGRPACVHA